MRKGLLAMRRGSPWNYYFKHVGPWFQKSWASRSSWGIFFSIQAARPQYDQNEPQRSYFEQLGALAPDMARTGLRGLILSIWAAWAQICPE